MIDPAALPEATITVHQFGTEREPVVQIDGFSGQVDALLAQGRSATYRPAGAYYPGLRAPAKPDYLVPRNAMMAEIMRRVFGFWQSLRCEAAAFSLVMLAPDDLSPSQRIPHYDDTGPGIVAVMHYLLGPESGGTAFYRHRRSGFETVTPERKPAYHAALVRDDLEYGAPGGGYHYGDSDRYEMIGEIEAAPDRMILYRGRLLHSGVIPTPAELSEDPAKGRLTINMFLEGA